MFEARMIQGKLWRQILDALSAMITEAKWECTESGISLQAMDSSHVSLCSLLLECDGFDNYRCDRAMTMGVKLSSMLKIFKCSSPNDIITLKAEDDADTLCFVFESENNDKVSDYEMKLMDIDAEHLGIPDTEYSVVVSMPSAEFQKIIRDIAVLNETVNICCTKDGIRFSAEGDIGSGHIKLAARVVQDKEEDNVEIEMSEPVALTFSVEYLQHFVKATPLDHRVTLSMSPNTPLVVEYKIGDHGSIRYFLAPKIADDDE